MRARSWSRSHIHKYYKLNWAQGESPDTLPWLCAKDTETVLNLVSNAATTSSTKNLLTTSPANLILQWRLWTRPTRIPQPSLVCMWHYQITQQSEASVISHHVLERGVGYGQSVTTTGVQWHNTNLIEIRHAVPHNHSSLSLSIWMLKSPRGTMESPDRATFMTKPRRLVYLQTQQSESLTTYSQMEVTLIPWGKLQHGRHVCLSKPFPI